MGIHLCQSLGYLSLKVPLRNAKSQPGKQMVKVSSLSSRLLFFHLQYLHAISSKHHLSQFYGSVSLYRRVIEALFFYLCSMSSSMRCTSLSLSFVILPLFLLPTIDLWPTHGFVFFICASLTDGIMMKMDGSCVLVEL